MNSVVWKTTTVNKSYEVSSDGRVRRTRKMLNLPEGGTLNLAEQPLRPYVNQGYLFVNFSGRSFAIHRLVAEHFVDNPNHYNNVYHIDGDHFNNHKNNLRWISNKEQMELIRSSPRYTESRRRSVRVIRQETGVEYSSIRAAYEAIKPEIDGPFVYEKLRQSVLNSTSYCGVTLTRA